MSATPGTGELTTPITPAENGGNTAISSGPETNATNNGAALLADAVEKAMSLAPEPNADSGLAALTGIKPTDIPTSILPGSAQPARPETPKITPPDSTSETQAKTKAPLFPYVEEAKKALAEADARGVSAEDREKLVVEVQRATNKEGLLMSGVKIIEIDGKIAEARKNNNSPEEIAKLMAERNEAVAAREKAYTQIFEDTAKYAKRNKDRTGKSFEDVINEGILSEAEDIKDGLTRNLELAENSGDAGEIELAKLRLEAAEMHIGIIKKKKGRGIRALIRSVIMAAGATALTDGAKVTKGELTPQRGR